MTDVNDKKITISDFALKKRRSEKISMITCYDYSFAKIVDDCGIDSVLVGDSLGMVMLGYDTTLQVTMSDMLHHVKAVRRGVKNSFVIADMPYLSYHADIASAVMNAGKLISEGGADAVKIEGGKEICDVARALVRAKIPVVGHIGLTPQSVNVMGGYKIQGRSFSDAVRIVSDAIALQEAGVFSIVLECIPDELAGLITKLTEIPTIGIGSGRDCDGQVLVLQDMLGLYKNISPRFVKGFGNLLEDATRALKQYVSEVEGGIFPGDEHDFHMDNEIIEAVMKEFMDNGVNK